MTATAMVTVDLHGLVSAAEQMVKEEDWISLRQACRFFPRQRNRPVAPRTVERYITDGKHGVKLEAFRGPGVTWWTTRPAIARWLARLTALELGQTPEPTPSETQRRRAADAANKAREEIKRKARERERKPSD
jgi:hypothetical protein